MEDFLNKVSEGYNNLTRSGSSSDNGITFPTSSGLRNNAINSNSSMDLIFNKDIFTPSSWDKYIRNIIQKNYEDSCKNAYYWTFDGRKMYEEDVQKLSNIGNYVVSLKWRLLGTPNDIISLSQKIDHSCLLSTNSPMRDVELDTIINDLKIVKLSDALPVKCVEILTYPITSKPKLSIFDINPYISY